MAWHRDSITPGELKALRICAQKAWAEDTRYPLASSDRSDRGQCYVSACWLVDRLGGMVARTGGHYAWVSPDERWVIDLTDGHGMKPGPYFPNTDRAYRFASPPIDSQRVRRFTKRANRIFDNLDRILKLGLDLEGDALPAEEPQAVEDTNQQYWHDEPAYEPETTTYKFVYGNGQLEISPSHEHGELAGHTGLGPDHAGPMAVGYVNVASGRATWEVQANINIKALERVFKDYGKNIGWRWGGITNIEGEPISDEFAPKKSQVLNFLYDGGSDHLWISPAPAGELAARLARLDARGEGDVLGGRLRLVGRSAYLEVSGAHPSPDAIRSCYDFAQDRGLTLYAGNDNRLHTQPDLELDNTYDPHPDQPEESQFFNEPDEDDSGPTGILQCPMCNALQPNWYEYQEHRRTKHGDRPKEDVTDGKFPEVEESPIQDTHFTPLQPEIMPLGRLHAARVDGFRGGEDDDTYFVAFHYGSPIGYARVKDDRVLETLVSSEPLRRLILAKVQRYTQKEPKDLLEAPVPFIFDIDQDKIKVGQPGSRTSDIPGTFTPGGIVEGTYDPGGKVVVRTMTNTPYSVRHLIQLWYYEHPELTVKSVHMQDEAGGSTKLAGDQSVGGYVASLAASNPTVSTVARALQSAGGRVHVVGGAVRDAVMGKDPKDLDLMVTGLAPEKVDETLRQLPGRSDLTGKDFGVFRYRDKGGDVEVALPRRERSTGAGHQDFDVQADPHMTPAEDFYRRDFTANAMGVDLQSGKLIDPYKGVGDIRDGRLRMVNPDAFSDDPLRIVRGLGAHSRHGLYPDEQTRSQMTVNAPSLQAIAPERIQSELDRLFAGDNPAGAIRLAHETGTLPYILPEVDRAFGYDQNNPHHELQLGEHLVNVLDRASKLTKDPDLRLAALLHDIGKPDSAWLDPQTGTNHYYEGRLEDGTPVGANHEDVGADMTQAAMNRLRYPNDRIQRVSQLVQHHMWPAFTSQRGARRFLNRVGDHADDLFTLREADQGGKAYPTIGNEPPPPDLSKQRQLVSNVRESGEPTNRSQLAVNGQDLINIGIPQGPEIGRVLGILENAVIDNPQLNTPPMLLTMARTHAKV